MESDLESVSKIHPTLSVPKDPDPHVFVKILDNSLASELVLMDFFINSTLFA